MVEADIISVTKETRGDNHYGSKYLEKEYYRIRVKINGKYYVGHLEKSE